MRPDVLISSALFDAPHRFGVDSPGRLQPPFVPFWTDSRPGWWNIRPFPGYESPIKPIGGPVETDATQPFGRKVRWIRQDGLTGLVLAIEQVTEANWSQHDGSATCYSPFQSLVAHEVCRTRANPQPNCVHRPSASTATHLKPCATSLPSTDRTRCACAIARKERSFTFTWPWWASLCLERFAFSQPVVDDPVQHSHPKGPFQGFPNRPDLHDRSNPKEHGVRLSISKRGR